MDPNKSSLTNFSVVAFFDECNTLYTVPNSWITDPGQTITTCFWEPGNTEKVARYVEDMAMPQSTWTEYRAKIVAQSRSLSGARKKEKDYHYKSDIDRFNTDVESGRKIQKSKIPPKKKMADNYDDEVPPTPPQGKYKKQKTFHKRDPLTTARRTLEYSFQENGGNKRLFQNSSSTSQGNSASAALNDSSTISCIQGSLSRISAQLEELSKQVQMNTQLLQATNKIDFVGDEHFELPVTNKEELSTLNNRLSSMEEFSKLVKYLGCFGGKDWKDMTRRILSKLITNRFAVEINWVGGPTKIPFRQLKNIILLIAAAVRRHSIFKTFSQSDVEDVIKKWLRSASDRDGGRNMRRNRPFVQNNDVIPENLLVNTESTTLSFLNSE